MYSPDTKVRNRERETGATYANATAKIIAELIANGVR